MRTSTARRGGLPDRATLVDVAGAAGVSRQTVSNVLNAPERVAAPTRDRVRREIERLGFRPHTAARALRRRRAAALGIAVGAPADRRLGNVLDAFLFELTVAARERDVHVVTFSVPSEGDPMDQYEHLLGVQAVDGFLLTDTTRDDPRPAWLRSRGVPFASFGRVWDEPGSTSWVDVDGSAGVAAGVRHLAAQGYRSVGFLGWPAGSPVGDDRRAGWLAAAQELGLHRAGLESSAPQDVHAAAEAAAPLLDRLGSGGALICASDLLALGAWTVLRESGLRAGADVGLVGFDDGDVARSFDLTSVQQPLARIAATMLEMVTGAPSDDEPPVPGDAHRAPVKPAAVLLEPVVVGRSSSRPQSASSHGPAPAAPSHFTHGGTT